MLPTNYDNGKVHPSSENDQVKIFRIIADHIDTEQQKPGKSPKTIDIMEYEEKKIDNLQKTVSTMVNIDEERREFLGSAPESFTNLENRNAISNYRKPNQMAHGFNAQSLRINGFDEPTVYAKSDTDTSPDVNGKESVENYELGLVTRHYRAKSETPIPFVFRLQNRMKRENKSIESTSAASLNNIEKRNSSSTDALENFVSEKDDIESEDDKTFTTTNATPFNTETDSSSMALNFQIDAQPETNFSFRIERNIQTVSSTTELRAFSSITLESNGKHMTTKEGGKLRNSRVGNLTFQNDLKAVEKKAAVNMGAVNSKIVETEKKVLDLQDSNFTFPKNFSLNNTENLKLVYNVIAPLFKSIQSQSNRTNQWSIRNGSIIANYIETANKDGFWHDGVFYEGKKGDYSAFLSNASCEAFLKLLNQYPFTVAFLLAFCCGIIVIILAIIFLRGQTTKKSPKGYILKFSEAKKKDKNKTYSALKSSELSSSSSSSSQESREEKGKDSDVKQKSAPKRLDLNNGPMAFIRGVVGRVREKTTGASAFAKLEQAGKKVKAERSMRIHSAEDREEMPGRKGFFNWITDRISNLMHPAFGERECEESDIDSTELSRKRGLLNEKFSNAQKQKHSMFRRSPTSKQSFADIHTVISAMDLTSSGCCVGTPEQASRSELLSRVVSTGGESRKIDHMLIGQEWDRSFYVTHGMETLSDKPQHLLEHEAEDHETLDRNRIKASEAQGMGILSGTSSTHSLLNQIGKSINKAECLSRHPKPLPNYELKARL